MSHSRLENLSLGALLLPLLLACESPGSAGMAQDLEGPIVASNTDGEGDEAGGVALTDMQAERAALLSAVQAYSAQGSQQNVLAVFTSMLTSDTRYLELGQNILFGSAAALAFIQSDPATSAAKQTWHPVRVDVSADGLRGYTYGYTQATGAFGPGGATATFDGKFIAFWRKEANDVWRTNGYVQTFQRVITVAETPPGFESPSYKHYRYFPDTEPGALRTQLMEVDNAFAARALVVGPGQAFFEYAAPDAAVLSGQPSILYGRDVIRNTFANFASNGQLLWHAVDGDAAPSGDLGFTVGEAESHIFFPDGSPRVTYSKYLTVWKRQLTGEWLWVMDGGNARPAP